MIPNRFCFNPNVLQLSPREKTVSQDVRAPLETLGYQELLERGDLTVAPDPQDSPAPRETVEPQDLPECRDLR